MHCPACGFENPETASSCAQCGTALGAAATRATREIELQRELDAAREAVTSLRRFIPTVVADSVLHDRDRLRGERREAAVLFVDAVDFTKLSVSLDAEATFDLVNDLLGRLVECIHRYGGMVDKFTGDGLMAVFGAPVAHENNTEMAVRAALDMQRAVSEFEPVARAQLGAPLQVRIGAHSGPVVAGVLGTQEQAAYTVMGETVNLAARLQAAAPPGSILVSSRVYEQTRPFFHFQTSGTIQIKGFDQPIPTFEVAGDRAEPLPARGVLGVSSILLGRDYELNQLKDALAAFLSDQRGRLVVVHGEAGMGKSRLVSEWLSTPLHGPAVVWRGRCVPYTEGVGHAAFRSLLQDAFRVSQLPDTWETALTPALRPFLRQLLNLPLSAEDNLVFRNLEPERVKQLTALAMREWISIEAQTQPVIAVLDDFHWADDLSRDMLQSIVDLLDEVPLILCVMTRPQPRKPVKLAFDPPAAGLAAPRRVDMLLNPLSAAHSRALLGHLVDLTDLPEQVTATLLSRAEGNPFYIEEFVRMLIEKDYVKMSGGQWRVVPGMDLRAIEIPTSLTGLMMTRFDRLPNDFQQVMRDAAVIGLQFTARLLEEVERRLHGAAGIRPVLDRLTELGMLEARPEAAEATYAFMHILTQETLYNSLLHSQRPTLHRTVAESIEFLYSSDVINQAEALAHHYDRARVRDRAMLYAVLAGNRARQRFANQEAIEYYSRALQLAQHLSGHESARWQAAMGLGDVEQLIGEYEEAIAFYQATLQEWASATAEDRAWAMLKLGQVWDKRGDLHESEEWLQQALHQLDQVRAPMPDLRGQVYSELGWLSWRHGDMTAAQRWLEQGLTLVSNTQFYSVHSSILNRLGAVYFNRGQWQQAVTYVEQALALRDRLGDMVGYARSLNNLGILKWSSGDWSGAQADYQHALELQNKIGEMEGQAQVCTNLGVLHTARGEWHEAEEYLKRSLEITQKIGHPYESAVSHMNLGHLYLMQERWADSAQNLNSAIALFDEVGARGNTNLNTTYCLQGTLCLEQGQLDAAQEWAKRSHDMLQETSKSTGQDESQDWGFYEGLVGRIAMARGDMVSARRHIDRSVAIFKASSNSIEVGRLLYWSGVLAVKQRYIDRAHQDLTASREILAQLGAAADLKRVDQQLSQLSATGG